MLTVTLKWAKKNNKKTLNKPASRGMSSLGLHVLEAKNQEKVLVFICPVRWSQKMLNF